MLRKRKSSTRKLLNLKTIRESRIIGYNNHQLLYYSIVPYNLSVLSNDNIESKIFELMNLIRSTDNVEILCLNNRENFRFNKEYLLKRIQQESVNSIRKLLKKELNHIEDIQLRTATARSFLIGIRIRKTDAREIAQDISMMEKTFLQEGFTMQKLSQDELKTLLAVYFEQNVTTEKFESFDGERWLSDENIE